ncbi:hypothetical protein L9F63_015470, partial [Diploptera punctata]
LGSLLSKGIRWSLCIPSSCTATNLQVHLQNELSGTSGTEVTVNDSDCSIHEEKPFTSLDYFCIAILSILMLATLLSTGYEYIIVMERYVFSFNECKLLLTSIDGIKFISLCWILLANACLVIETLPAMNYKQSFKYWSLWPEIMVLNMELPVNTFLVCTGILISYNFFNDMNRRGFSKLRSGVEPRHVIHKTYLLVFYFHRFI